MDTVSCDCGVEFDVEDLADGCAFECPECGVEWVPVFEGNDVRLVAVEEDEDYKEEDEE